VLAFFVLVPLAALILINVPRKAVPAKAAAAVALALCVAQAAVVIIQPWDVFTSGGPLNRYFSFVQDADPLSMVMLLAISIVLFAAILVAWDGFTMSKQLFNFVSVLLIAMIGMNGTALVRDLFTLYVLLEVTAIASFILIAVARGRDALEGAFKYIVLSAVASALMVTGIAAFLLMGGDTDFAAVAHAFRTSPNHIYIKIAAGAFLCGLFIKGGLVPFHAWVPGAYASAPAATSVMLAGIGTKMSGIYALIRIMTSVFGANPAIQHVLLLVGAVSILVGAFAALGQKNLKWLLSYSSISQVGYIVLGLAVGTPLGLMGAIFHFFNHAVLKSLLFVNSAALEERIGSTDMDRMGGLGARMPFTSVTASVGALSTAGVPPLSGFWSKLIIIIALWQAHFYGYAVVAIGASVLTLAYMLLMQRRIFFGTPTDASAAVTEARFALVFSEVLLAAITVGIGIAIPFAPFALDTLKSVVAGIR
jgi:multicomponent Na+:H+ antiporter subunit D